MSADLLREAAALMRERAQAATPGPWSTSPNAAYGSVVSPHADGLADNGALDVEAYGGYLIGESITNANREYIAGMHPTVALAVADLLDHEADACGLNRSPFVDEGHRLAHILAATYLGRES